MRSASETEVHWIRLWNEMFEIIEREPAILVVDESWRSISTEEWKGLIQDAVYAGLSPRFEWTWFQGKRALRICDARAAGQTSVAALLHDLGSLEDEVRLAAFRALAERGTSTLDDLGAVLGSPGASPVSRVWTMMLIARLGPVAADSVRHALRTCLADPSPTIRRQAIVTFGALEDRKVLAEIRDLTTDGTQDPSAWGEADCTVGEAAATFLKRVGGA